jgi:hypothetical protein
MFTPEDVTNFTADLSSGKRKRFYEEGAKTHLKEGQKKP